MAQKWQKSSKSDIFSLLYTHRLEELIIFLKNVRKKTYLSKKRPFLELKNIDFQRHFSRKKIKKSRFFCKATNNACQCLGSPTRDSAKNRGPKPPFFGFWTLFSGFRGYPPFFGGKTTGGRHLFHPPDPPRRGGPGGFLAKKRPKSLKNHPKSDPFSLLHTHGLEDAI